MALCEKCKIPLPEKIIEIDHCKTCDHKEGCWLREEYCENCLNEMHTSVDGIEEQYRNLSIEEKMVLDIMVTEKVLISKLKETKSKLHKNFKDLNRN